MSDKEIPFYTQTAILDRYIHRAKTDISPEIIETIIEILRGNADLKTYFFRNKPHSDWVSILWDKGFFDSPPAPVSTADGAILPRWDVQDFLISVANQVPDIVIKHVESIEGQGWYVSQALRALNDVPLQYVEKTIPRLLEFLNGPVIDRMVFEYIYDLMLLFAKNNHVDSTFALFESLTEPVISNTKVKINLYSENVPGSKSDTVFADWKEPNLINLLSNLNSNKVIKILENHLRKAVVLEETDLESPYYKKGSSWQAAIEDSDQNHHLDYKETLLQKLRDAINIQMQKNDPEIQFLVREFLVDDFNIFKRLSIHFIREYPMVFQNELNQLLSNYENLDDYFIHHEFFLLLRDGYIYLTPKDQQQLINQIIKGPSQDTQNDYLEWWAKTPAKEMTSQQDYVQRQIKNWKYKRLWMIQGNLEGQNKIIFDDLRLEFGEPELPPEFTSYISGMREIQHVSPLSTSEIAVLSPPDLFAFLIQWKPETNHLLWPNEQTYASLGRQVAKVIFENPTKYQEILFDIARINSGYGYTIIDEFSKLSQPTGELWQLIMGLSGKLLEIEEIRLSNSPIVDNSWYYFKSSLARLLGDSFSNPQKKTPNELQTKIRDILLILVNDPDPNQERDQPPKDHMGFGDPSHVALNSIRPIALNALITYAMEEYKQEHKNYAQDLGPKRLAIEIKDVLDAKLDPNQEPSRAVRSVLGQRLINLFWLDKEWVMKNLDRIFPTDSAEESKWLFTSAISSYIIFGNFYQEIFDILKPKYEQALYYFSKGYLWRTHLQPIPRLAGHLIWSYLISDYKFDLSELDYSNLFVKFFDIFDGEGRKDGAFICRRLFDDQENIEKYWDQIRKIWEWRVQETVQAGHTNDFDGELLQFAQLASVAPSGENIQSLWPLLTATVPHLRGKQFRDWGWDAIEDFLAKNVGTEPIWAIRLYTMIYEQAPPPVWQTKSDAARKIIETAVKDKEAKQVACDLINYIGSHLGDDSYRDLYEKYC